MLRVTVAGIRGHVLRFVLTVLSVTLGVAFVAGTFVLTDSLDRTFTGIFSQANAGTDVYVRGAEGASGLDGTALRGQLPIALADDLAEVEGVEVAYPDLFGTGVLVGDDGTAVRRGGAPTLAVAWLDDDPVLEVLDGREPSGRDEVAVEEATLSAAGLEVGDSTSLVIGGEVLPVTITAEVRFGALAGATLVLLGEQAATELFAPQGEVSAFVVRGDGTRSQAELAAAIEGILPPGAEAVTGEAKTAEDTEAIGEALGFISTFLLVFAAISLVVGAFIIVNTFSMLVAQRTREMALLRAVGAGAGQVVRMVLAEAAVVGLVGGALGLAVGIGLAWLLGLMLTTFGGLEVSGGLPVLPRTVVVSLTIGLLVTMAAAVVPAVRAARIAPVAAMRDDVALPERSLRLRGAVGGLMLVASGVGLPVALAADGTASGLGVGASALGLFLGTAVSAPLLARPVLRALGAPFAALARPLGGLARQNALRNPRRTATTASALMIGLALVTGVSVLSASTTASTQSIVDSVVKADLVLDGGFTGIAPGVSDAVGEVDGVASATAMAAVPAVLDGQSQFATAAEPQGLADALDVTMVAGSLDALADGEVLVSESEADDNGWSVGSEVSAVVGALPDETLVVGGVFEDNQALGYPVIVPTELADRAVPAPQQVDLLTYVVAEPGADLAQVRQDVVDVVKEYVVVSVQDRDEFVSSQADQTQQLLVIIYVLLALSVVIAVLGIVNTLALSVFERTREIGLLRAVGMTRGQLSRVITIESVLTALFGAVLGTVLGLVLGIALQRALVDDGLVELVVPVTGLVGVFALAAVVGVLAAALPAVRATRLDVLRAITTE